jgi:hypothetical protein
VPLYPPQIPHDLTLARTRAVAMGSYSLTAWAITLPTGCFFLKVFTKCYFSALF